MQLSPQTIEFYAKCPGLEMIQPFTHRHVHTSTGLSGGLGCAGYDVHLGNKLEAPTNAAGLKMFCNSPVMEGGAWLIAPHTGVLGVTKERFNLPPNIAMQYFNKSTLARRFINACATLAEPGWCGYLTLEIYNQTDRSIYLEPGQPIGQVVFHELDKPSNSPYTGKYQNQEAVPVQGKKE